MHLSNTERRAQLKSLAQTEGFENVDALREATAVDSVAPAICIRCGHTADMEPDQDAGYCEACGETKMVSALVLAGLV